jgi:transposase InsO family protein
MTTVFIAACRCWQTIPDTFDAEIVSWRWNAAMELGEMGRFGGICAFLPSIILSSQNA